MSYQLQRERVHGLWDESAELLQAGFVEHDPDPDLPLDVDRKLYEALEEAGTLRVYTARLEGRLVGYAVFTVAPSMRRRYLKTANQDLVHVEPPVRGRVTAALLRHAEKALAADGVELVYHSTPENGSRFGRLLEILGYRPVGRTYAKRLE